LGLGEVSEILPLSKKSASDNADLESETPILVLGVERIETGTLQVYELLTLQESSMIAGKVTLILA
jgi:hypothetical protein